MKGVEVNKVRGRHTQQCGLTAPEECEQSLLPHQLHYHPQRALTLHVVVQLYPGEGRRQGHRHPRRAGAACTSRTGVDQGVVAQQARHLSDSELTLSSNVTREVFQVLLLTTYLSPTCLNLHISFHVSLE